MKIHKEGYSTLILSFLLLAILNTVFYYFFEDSFWQSFVAGFSTVLFIFLLSFFRKPNRSVKEPDEGVVLSPCDGKVVVIEKVTENEFIKGECIMVSVFMSPLNVHINWYPVNGSVLYTKYHPGKFLAAWNPKASEENERTSIGLSFTHGKLLLRQVAGALARRIVFYSRENQTATQGDELGFIKFGSRVDLYLPINAKVRVKLDDVVTGNRSVIADF
ncbi:MAG: phosphatidylserine decarboxylase family protein [Saprospiraceae bacterium]|nr:phosphatidylserine decarboxylase family protein [Saprospiraceae bacterium]